MDETFPRRKYVQVRLPWDEMSLEDIPPELILKLDPGAEGASLLEIDATLWMNENAFDQDELRRVIIGAALLLEYKAGTVAECLKTAMIWERG